MKVRKYAEECERTQARRRMKRSENQEKQIAVKSQQNFFNEKRSCVPPRHFQRSWQTLVAEEPWKRPKRGPGVQSRTRLGVSLGAPHVKRR